MIPQELPGDDPDDVLFNRLYGIRTIELNRPKKLNSLNASMVRKIIPRVRVCPISSSSAYIFISVLSRKGQSTIGGTWD